MLPFRVQLISIAFSLHLFRFSLAINDVNFASLNCLLKPRFHFNPADCHPVISNQETWRAGCPTSLAILSRHSHSIELHVDTLGGSDNTKVSLQYRCTTRIQSLQRQSVDGGIGMIKENLCKHFRINFSVSLKSSENGKRVFVLQFFTSSLNTTEVFLNPLEVSAVMTYSSCGAEETITSNPLFIYYMEPLINFKNSDNEFQSLTKSAESLLLNFTIPQDRQFKEIQFLRSDFTRDFGKCFLRDYLLYGVSMNYGEWDCVTAWTGKGIGFISAGNPGIRMGLDMQFNHYLDMDSGKLTFSWVGVNHLMSNQQRSTSSAGQSICALSQFGKNLLGVSRQQQTQQVGHVGEFRPDAMVSDRPCKYVGGIERQKEIELISGVSETIVKCPYVCEIETARVDIKHNGRSLLQGSSSLGQVVYQNTFSFPMHTNQKHEGLYTCSHKDIPDTNFMFNVTILKLPSFLRRNTQGGIEEVGYLPPFVYAVEGQSVKFSCQVFYLGFSVSMTSQEEPNDRRILAWKTDIYQKYVTVANRTTSPEDKATISVAIQRVPSAVRGFNISHRWTCKAQANGGVPQLQFGKYFIETTTSVLFIPTLRKTDFRRSGRCFKNNCTTLLGEALAFKLSKRLSSYLRQIKVKITGHFVFKNIQAKKWEGINSRFTTFNPNDDFHLRFDPEFPEPGDDISMQQLQKASGIVPVYNFHYEGGIPNSVLHDKARYRRKYRDYAQDCLKISDCFYSTMFVSYVEDESLDFLETKFVRKEELEASLKMLQSTDITCIKANDSVQIVYSLSPSDVIWLWLAIASVILLTVPLIGTCFIIHRLPQRLRRKRRVSFHVENRMPSSSFTSSFVSSGDMETQKQSFARNHDVTAATY